MNIILNGQKKEFDSSMNLKSIIEHSCQNCTKVVAELNGNIIKKETWESTNINDGDQIELVTFVGGG